MRDLNALAPAELFDELVDRDALDRLLSAALREDLGEAGDVTSASIIDSSRRATAIFVPRVPGVFCGRLVVAALCRRLRADCADLGPVQFEPIAADGDRCHGGQPVAQLEGSLRAILAVERTALNLMCRMSGIATLTAQFVAAIVGTDAVICDTRKTMPGMRGLDKFAVRCGGGTLHRVGLHDAAMYKDNHLAGVAVSDLRDVITEAAAKARADHELRFVEVEVDSLAQIERVLAVEPGLVDYILLDNFTAEDLRAAVRMRDDRNPRVRLEASGGVNLNTVRAIAETGVDRISVGALTHSGPHLDIGLDVQ